jgi:hypothetical protein
LSPSAKLAAYDLTMLRIRAPYLVINLLSRKAVTYEGGRLPPMEDDPSMNPSVHVRSTLSAKVRY